MVRGKPIEYVGAGFGVVWSRFRARVVQRTGCRQVGQGVSAASASIVRLGYSPSSGAAWMSRAGGRACPRTEGHSFAPRVPLKLWKPCQIVPAYNIEVEPMIERFLRVNEVRIAFLHGAAAIDLPTPCLRAA